MVRNPLRLAVVGCGAIAERGHLPGAQSVEEVVTTVLVDTNHARARALASVFGVPRTSESLDGIERHADAAIVALPHHLHASTTVDLLSRGMHVLVEKPMAGNVAECDQMIEAADRSGTVLAVGLARRLSWANRFVKETLQAGLLGPVKSFTIEDGAVYSWPSATTFILRKETAGGGVLIGNGSHVLDSVIWWFGEPERFTCATDARGGLEADCRIEMTMPDGAEGVVELSRTRTLTNRCVTQCERGTMDTPLAGDSMTLSIAGSTLALRGRATPDAPRGAHSQGVMADQIRAFAEAVRTGGPPPVSGRDARRSIQLIEACYARTQPLPSPWIRPVELPARQLNAVAPE